MGYLVSLKPIWSTVRPRVNFFFHLSLKSYIHLKYTSRTFYLLIVRRLVNYVLAFHSHGHPNIFAYNQHGYSVL